MLQHMRPPPELDRGYKRKGGPTVDQIFSDPLTQLSMKVWAPQVPPDRRVLIPDLINNIYQRECLNSGFSTRRLMILELSQYLENYLWPHFHPGASKQHVLSIVAMVNEKYREGLQPWDVFVEFPQISVLLPCRVWKVRYRHIQRRTSRSNDSEENTVCPRNQRREITTFNTSSGGLSSREGVEARAPRTDQDQLDPDRYF